MIAKSSSQISPVYPFPLKPSEISRQETDSNIKPIPLKESEILSLLNFEESLFNQVKEIKDISVSNHILYTEPLLTKQGQFLFTNIYIHFPEIKNQIDAYLKETDINIEDKKDKKKIWDSVSLDLIENTEKVEQGQFHFKNFKKLIINKGYKGKEVTINLFPSQNLDIKQVENIIKKSDIKDIPKEIRLKMDKHTSDMAEKTFKELLKKNNLNIKQISNPKRVVQIVDSQKLEEKITKLKEFKKEIKQLIKIKKEKEDNLPQAELIVLQIYRRFVNVSLARTYRLDKKYDSNIEKLDHFINGVNLSFQTIPQKLKEIATSDPQGSESTEIYKKYNKTKINAELAKEIFEKVIEEYGWNEIEEPWKVVIRKNNNPSLGVEPKSKEIRVPKNFNRGLIDSLSVLAHEIEGHVFVHVNSDNQPNNLKLISNYGLGRSNVLKEGASTYIEEKTRKEISNMKKPIESQYLLLALITKENGGSFKECFKTIFDTYKNEKGFSFDICFQYAYNRALRIFRGITSLDDKSGKINNSDQLKYLEQEIVVEELKKKGLEKIVFIDGIDLVSIPDILKLGIIDFNKVAFPRMIIANKIWPIFKSQVDKNQKLSLS